MNLNQLLTYESLTYHFKTIKDKFINSESKTKNKNIQIPKVSEVVSDKSSYVLTL